MNHRRYFETFLILSGWSVDERKHWDSQLAKCTTKEQTGINGSVWRIF